MRSPLRFHALVVSAATTALFLSACGPDPDVTVSPSPIVESSRSSEPTEAAPSQEAVRTEQTAEGSPAGTETPQTQPMSTRDAVPAGPLDGEKLNAAGVAWFGTFCSGFTEASSVGQQDNSGMSVEETTDLILYTYESVGGVFRTMATELDVLDAGMNFQNAEAFSEETIDILYEVGTLYLKSATALTESGYPSERVLRDLVDRTGAWVTEAGGFDLGLAALDPSVLEAAQQQVPSCSFLPS